MATAGVEKPTGTAVVLGALERSIGAVAAGLAPGWGPIVERAGLAAALRAVDALGDGERVAPPPERILEALRYCAPDEVAVVVGGQDPFPAPGDADGLAFSSEGVPPALQRVFGCLQAHGLMPAGRPAAAQRGRLGALAAQGVLLLNAALTTRAGARGAHGKEWAPFTRALAAELGRVAADGGRRLIFLLWGGKAQKAFGEAAGRHTVWTWTHPSPLSDNMAARKFVACPHFADANRELAAAGRPPIVWDNQAPAMIFADGSCSRNGCPDATAGFGTVFAGGVVARSEAWGGAMPREYALVDPADPRRGFATVRDRPPVPCTNNRAEYLALCWGLYGALRAGLAGRVELVSDSDICVRTLRDWLPARRAKGKEGELKNLDLVLLADALLGALRAQAAEVVLTHCRGHQPRPVGGDARAFCIWKGNARADALAARGCALPQGARTCESPLPALVRALTACG